MAATKEILLIFPRLRYPSGDVPTGILYLASSVRKKLGLTPDILDLSFSKKPMDDVRRTLSENTYRWVGLSAMVTMAVAAREVAALVKQMQPQTQIILGGPHPTTLPEKCLDGPFDYLALGEAEETLPELIRKGGGEGVAGVWFRKSGLWVQNAARPPIADLDDLPFPAFDLVDLEKYKRLWFQLDTIGRPVSGTSILATRGCPHQCAFCQPTLERLFGRKLRKRSPGNIVEELAWLKDRFKIDGFIFLDDTLVVDRAWSRTLAEKIIAAKLGLVFGCNMRAELVEEDILRILKEAGLRKIYLGIESCSDRVRNEVLNKKLKSEEIERAVAVAKKLGVKAQGYFMIGAPGESRDEVRSTISYGRRLDLDDITINITTPLPGTFLYSKFREVIDLPEENFDYYRRYAFKQGDLTEGWLRREQLLGYLGFYLRPRKFVEQLRQLFSPRLFARNLLKLKRVI